MNNIIKIIISGTPISKSNFKLNSKNGNYILPSASGKYHDRYAVYEEYIAYETKRQYPNITFESSLTAILNVYYKYEKKHPDTNNITKSIFDGIEKSGIIINDSQITKLYVEEFYDKENPRFELSLFENHLYDIKVSIKKRETPVDKIIYTKSLSCKKINPINYTSSDDNSLTCYICNKTIKNNDYVKISQTNSILCKNCLKKTK